VVYELAPSRANARLGKKKASGTPIKILSLIDVQKDVDNYVATRYLVTPIVFGPVAR
jgi:hypothetical protein